MDPSQSSERNTLPPLHTADNSMAHISPARSRTDPPASEKNGQEKSHLHRRLHSNTLRHRAFTGSSKEHHYRHSAKETVQSAIELKPPISFDALLRREKKSPESSQRSSGSQQAQQQAQQQATAEARAQKALNAERRRVKPEDVTKAKQENAQREKELRDSLRKVDEVAMSSTRQLDDTYYSILEKASILRSTVASLQQLAEESRRMHSQFQEDTTKLCQDTRSNLDGFGNFDAQEKRINKLVNQLKGSKSKTDKLNDRLEAARNRVEALEKRELEKKNSRRKRWSVAWGVIVAVIGLIIALIVAKHRSTVGSRVYHVAKVIDELGNEFASPIADALIKPRSTEDPYLQKLFDDL